MFFDITPSVPFEKSIGAEPSVAMTLYVEDRMLQDVSI